MDSEKTVYEELEVLQGLCNHVHIPKGQNTEEYQALGLLVSEGMGVCVGACPWRSDMRHANFPDERWRLLDDEEARSKDPRDRGSVIVLFGKDALASIISTKEGTRSRFCLVPV